MEIVVAEAKLKIIKGRQLDILSETENLIGYAGDFQLVDKIHMNEISENPKFTAWDMMYQNLAASVALRNRKAYMNDLFDQEIKEKGYIRVLNIGSGPCRDIREFMDERPNIAIDIDCIDSDQSAISFSTELCERYKDNVHIKIGNVLRYKTDLKYDVVWSAGLFDYFKDKFFKALVSRFYNYVKPGGLLALGNINTTNPHKTEMEILGQWYLHHRSEEQLRNLVIDAGVDEELVSVHCEPTTVNIFAHARKL